MSRVQLRGLAGTRLAIVAAGWLAVLVCAIVAIPAAAQQAPPDDCPYGWSTEQTVSFDRRGGDSGVLNPTLANGCTLLDIVWNDEPFATHGQFVRTVRRATREFWQLGLLSTTQMGRINAAAARSDVGKRRDSSIDNSCQNRIALTFDDGPSFYRPQTLAILRQRQVPAVSFDLGIRVDANPQLARFEATEGHLVLSHTYSHPNLAQISPESVRRQILEAEAAFARAGAPLPFKTLRPPFGSSNPSVQALAAELGYTLNAARGSTTPPVIGSGSLDFLPTRTAAQIADVVVNSLRPGGMIILHDGPIDTPAGAATVEALPLIIDAARRRGYCFGLLDDQNRVVAARHVPTQRRIPSIINPVPYLPLQFADGLTPPNPYLIVDHPF